MAGGSRPALGEQEEEELVEEEEEEEDDDPNVDIQRFIEDMVSGSDDTIKEDAINALKHLYIKFKCGYGITRAMLSIGVMPPLVRFVDSGTDTQKVKAAELISSLAYSIRFGLPGDGRNSIHVAIQSLQGYRPLAALLTHGRAEQQERAAAALENLAVTPTERSLVAEAFDGCAALARLVREGSACQRELAVRLLRAMLVDGHAEAKREAAGVISEYALRIEARGVEGKVDGAPEITVC